MRHGRSGRKFGTKGEGTIVTAAADGIASDRLPKLLEIAGSQGEEAGVRVSEVPDRKMPQEVTIYLVTTADGLIFRLTMY